MCGSSPDKGKLWGSLLLPGIGTLAGAGKDSAKKAEQEAAAAAAQQQKNNDEMLAELRKPTATIVDPLIDPTEKNKRLRALRSGLLSTIKTSPMGVSNLGGKTKLGQ